MKLHKKLLFGVIAVLLAACSGNIESTDEPPEESQIMFNHGVNSDYEILGDSQNYLNFTGTLHENIDSDQVAVIDPETNIVLGIADVDENNEFYISTNMQGAGDREIIFTYDESVEIPTVESIDSLNSIAPMYYIENTLSDTNKSASNEEETENTTAENKSATDEAEENSSEQLIGLNEEIAFGTADEELFKLTITRVTNNQNAFPDHMVGLDEYNTDRIVAISIDYENVAYEGGFRPSTHDFQAYTKDGKALERINQQSGQDPISEGRKATTQIYFSFPDNDDDLGNIELDYLDYGNVLATFDLLVE